METPVSSVHVRCLEEEEKTGERQRMERERERDESDDFSHKDGK